MSYEIPVFSIIQWNNYQNKNILYSLGTKHFIYCGSSLENKFELFYEITNEIKDPYGKGSFQIVLNKYTQLKHERYTTAFVDLSDAPICKTNQDVSENKDNIKFITKMEPKDAIEAYQRLSSEGKNISNAIKEDIRKSIAENCILPINET